MAQHKEGVLDKAYELKKILEQNYRVELDDSDNSPGWKFNQWEMKGVPIRLEIGPRDIENGQAVLARRDTSEKITVALDEVGTQAGDRLDAIQKNLFEKSLKMREEKTSSAENMDEFQEKLAENPGFIKAMWCGDRACEDQIKEQTGASLRAVPFDEEQEIIGDGTCVCCGKPAEKVAWFARAY